MKIKCPSCGKNISISKDNLQCSKCEYTIKKSDLLELKKKYDEAEEDRLIDESGEFSTKDCDTAGILCLCLGAFGAHRFYLGKYFSGIMMFLLSFSILLTKFIGFGYVFLLYCALYCWIIVDIWFASYNFYTDSKGKPLRTESYVVSLPFVILPLLFFFVFALLFYSYRYLFFITQSIMCFCAFIMTLIKYIRGHI